MWTDNSGQERKEPQFMLDNSMQPLLARTGGGELSASVDYQGG